jgi:putative membrane protein
MKLLIHWLITALALAAAAYLIPGIEVTDTGALPGWAVVAIMAVIFGLVNALIRPILKFLTCPLIILTLGLFTLVINALMLWLASWISGLFGAGFRVDGFWAAFWGALVISVVSWLLSMLFGVSDRKQQPPPARQPEVRERW